MLKVLRISHSATLSAYRERERALSREAGIELALVCPEKWPHLGGGDNSIARINESFACRTTKTLGTGAVPLFAFDPLPIADMLRKFQPDVVDIHEEPYSVSCIEALLLAQRYSPQSVCVFYSAQNINKRYPPPFSWSERYVYQSSMGAYPCGTSVQEVLLAKGFSRPCPVIPLGFSPEQFHLNAGKLPIGAAEPRFSLGYTGRLEECKGVQYLLQAIKLLKERGEAIRLLVAGTGTYEPVLRSMCQDLQIGNDTFWLGELPAQAMPKFYATCDATVVPSITTPRWREQFGRVPVESMACGTPVIVSDSGSLTEVVGQAGLIVPEMDHVALSNAVYELMHDANRREQLKRAGVAHVSAEYTWKKVAQMMITLYRQALEQGANRRLPKREVVAGRR